MRQATKTRKLQVIKLLLALTYSNILLSLTR
jgi:hypothetical protein